ncbi:MAG: tetratricopeptide repeat protein [Termitinemataceae bacterium]
MKTKPGSSYIQEALSLGRQGDYAKAVHILEEYIAKSEKIETEALLLLGRAYHALGLVPRALVLFRDFIQQNPDNAQGYFFAGRSYMSLGMYPQALSLLRKAQSLRPADPQILAMLGITCLKARRSREAVELLQQAVEKLPTNQKVYRSYLNALLVRGIKLCRLGEIDLGSQMLHFVLDNGLQVPLPHLELGRVYREAGNLDQALYHYTQACTLAPEDTQIRWYRAAILMAMGQQQAALEEIRRIRNLGGEAPELSWNAELVERFMIRSFLADGAWQRAALACGNWLRRRGHDPMIHAMYAEALRNLGDLIAATNHINKALELANNQVELRYAQLMLAWESEDWQTLQKTLTALQRLGGDPAIIQRFQALLNDHLLQDDKQVISQLQQAIHATGPSPELMFALAQRYFRIGLPDLAEGWYCKTRLVQKHHERAYLGEIAALEQLVQNNDEAAKQRLISVYQLYLQYWPDNRAIRREFALFLVKQQFFPEAELELEALLAWDSTNRTLRRLLAYVYRKNKKYRDAALLLRGLLKEDPHNEELLLEFVGCMERSNLGKYAFIILEKAYGHFKTSANIAIVFGDALYKGKQIEKALDVYREAVNRSPNDFRPYERMAMIYRKQGVIEMALRYEQEANIRKNAKKQVAES